ncbi:DUF1674 domain-containing protein [Rhodobaculum claviforme]|uniref:DUF1674 domain-containing protein n=1 Tax=Rhodobaculum claviforme TaxID=1549854 RepID=A0A934TL25_9RHOB|nr:DUF1674 domain-containing protein [Rhodobaculum claviforme]
MDTPADRPPEQPTACAPDACAPDAEHPSASLPPAAQRALAEAEERRRKARALTLPPEEGGRDGPEPVRFGDWERKGIAVDF